MKRMQLRYWKSDSLVFSLLFNVVLYPSTVEFP